MPFGRFLKRKEESPPLSSSSTRPFVDGIQKVSSEETHRGVTVFPEKEKVSHGKEKEDVSTPRVVTEGTKETEKAEGGTQSTAVNDEISSQNISPKSEEVSQIEAILEDGLGESFDSLPPRLQEEFRFQGEKTAIKISELLHTTKIKIKKILGLIRSWLKMLPGVSQLFIEQDAREKVEKILQIRKK